PVRHDPRQPVRLTEDQPIEWSLEESFADLESPLNSIPDERGVDLLLSAAGQQPHGDERSRVDVAPPDPGAPRVADIDDLPWLHSGQGCRLHIDFVAVDPEVSGPDSTVLVLPQLDCGRRRHS